MTRKLPIKTKEVELDGDYTGWKMICRLNPPTRLVVELSAGDLSRSIPALSEIILSWNFVNEEGVDLGPPSPETFQELPIDLIIAVSTAYQKASSEVYKPTPN